jgi:hypothetical protein
MSQSRPRGRVIAARPTAHPHPIPTSVSSSASTEKGVASSTSSLPSSSIPRRSPPRRTPQPLTSNVTATTGTGVAPLAVPSSSSSSLLLVTPVGRSSPPRRAQPNVGSVAPKSTQAILPSSAAATAAAATSTGIRSNNGNTDNGGLFGASFLGDDSPSITMDAPGNASLSQWASSLFSHQRPSPPYGDAHGHVATHPVAPSITIASGHDNIFDDFDLTPQPQTFAGEAASRPFPSSRTTTNTAPPLTLPPSSLAWLDDINFDVTPQPRVAVAPIPLETTTGTRHDHHHNDQHAVSARLHQFNQTIAQQYAELKELRHSMHEARSALSVFEDTPTPITPSLYPQPYPSTMNPAPAGHAGTLQSIASAHRVPRPSGQGHMPSSTLPLYNANSIPSVSKPSIRTYDIPERDTSTPTTLAGPTPQQASLPSTTNNNSNNTMKHTNIDMCKEHVTQIRHLQQSLLEERVARQTAERQCQVY